MTSSWFLFSTQILTYLLLRRLNVFPFIDFMTLKRKWLWKVLTGYSFQGMVTNVGYTCLVLYPCCGVYWLAFFWFAQLWNTYVTKKCHFPNNITGITCSVPTISLHRYWSSAKKQLCEVLRAFIKILQCKRQQVCTIQHLGRKWNATVGRYNIWELIVPAAWPATLLRLADEQPQGWCSIWVMTVSIT